jgi:curved DNA-binding protein CbpA
MDQHLPQTVEIETLKELLDELDYYNVLQVDPLAPMDVIERAYRAEARRLHPDRFSRHPDREIKRSANKIYRIVLESWKTLSDPDAREAYDNELEEGRRRMSEEAKKAAEEAAARAANPIHAAQTEKGLKFWRMALRNWRDKEYSGCKMNIQFALNYEPDNEVFKEWLEKAGSAAAEDANENRNPYKLRIV